MKKVRERMDVTDNVAGRPVRESQSEMIEMVLPNDANPLGALLGGRLMHWIDIAGGLAAQRHSRSNVVTASIDHLDFLVPVHVGDLVILQSSVNRVYRTSLETGVRVLVESYITGERRHVSSAYVTYVAVDRHGRKMSIPPAIPETDEEKRRFEDAAHRREMRRVETERKRQARALQQ
ncbi:MAG TPA: acyl-CoA thioesterase [Clostridia bacterium]|nr:acyl-CoA thioesterase [Clostridia bacterium]